MAMLQKGWTVLHEAVSANKLDITKYLVEQCNVDFTLKNKVCIKYTTCYINVTKLSLHRMDQRLCILHVGKEVQI